MSTFEQARQRVAALLASGEQLGTVAPHGFKDARDWLVVVETDLVIMGGPTYLVNRRTGKVHLESYVANLARFEAMTSTGGRTFRAECPEGFVEWHARAPHLTGTPDLVARVAAPLLLGGTILLTPTGPAVPALVSSPEGVLAALLQLGPVFEFSGAVPLVPGVPEDAVA